MPLKNGFDVCGDIQNIPRLRDVPVLVMTAFGQDIGEIHGVSMQKPPANIRGCLEKPFEINVLLERVASALEENCPAAPAHRAVSAARSANRSEALRQAEDSQGKGTTSDGFGQFDAARLL